MDSTSPLIHTVAFAAEKHKNQRRKDQESTPYINHPIHVAQLLVEGGIRDIDTLQAALLHDTVEDTQTTLQELRDKFGLEVANIVDQVSDDKSLPKVERKRLQISHAADVCEQAKLVKLADKLSNLSSLESNPPKAWDQKQINGYFLWTFEVCDKLKGTNQYLEKKLWEIFEGRGILSLSVEERKNSLEEYYHHI